MAALTGLRNLLYAIEWWFFGAFAAFIWWRWVRDEESGRDADHTPDGAGEDAGTAAEATSVG